MRTKFSGKSEKVYINEIIRITYKCNWKCKFCNVIKVNNYGETDISSKEVINKIFNLVKKYPSISERKNIILSFSGGEPTLNKNLPQYIQLAKKIGVGTVEVQTNGTILFVKKTLVNDLIEAGLDEIFLAQHSHKEEINKSLGIFYKREDFIDWVNFIKGNELYKKVNIYLNIVVGKINLPSLKEYISFLKKIGFLDFIVQTIWIKDEKEISLRKISFGLTQPNGYAELNAKEVLLRFDKEEMTILNEVIKYCEEINIYPDFHFTSPPLCILNYPDYNLEYMRLQKLEKDREKGDINSGNLESYQFLWKEKVKFKKCKLCIHDKFCLGFYKNWVSFVGEEHVQECIYKFISK